ncbi:MAG: trypsin-like peptidase domain-containing protein [Deltaproteobacteria bacterium]|nr:trypsin-like peptidase domain-containing protein [Deltaproteobacteria bacterium]
MGDRTGPGEAPGRGSGTWRATASAPVDFAKLTGAQWKALQDALLDAFPRYGELQQFVRQYLGENLPAITDKGNLNQDIYELIQWSQARGTTARLYAAARTERPDQPALVAFGLTVRRPGQDETSVGVGALQELLTTAPLVPLTELLRTLGQVQGRVCRVEVQGQAVGTGFLVGPSAVLTCYHVMERVLQGPAAPSDVRLRFDCVDGGGGTLAGLAEQWCIDKSPYAPFEREAPGEGVPTTEELDYVLLRTRERLSEAPVGESSTASAPRRGAVTLRDEPRRLPDTALFIVQHPGGRPQQIAFETRGVLAYNANETRMKHRVNTEHGSSGSPVFDFKGALVALHHAGDPATVPVYNQAVPSGKIYASLEARGVLQKLDS